MDDKETWKNKMTKNTACKLKSNPMTTKHTTVILPNSEIDKVNILINALLKIIEMNRQTAEDQYGNPDKAESWSCVSVAREAIRKYQDDDLKF